MTRKTGIIYLVITAVLITFFFTFSGCSDSLNSPLSPETQMGDFGLTGGGGKEYSGIDPSEEWESFMDPSILGTRDGESLSAADITLEYDPSELPPGVELRAVFTNPNAYEFHIVPTGHARNTDIRVTIDYSKAYLDEDDEEDESPDLVVCGIENNQLIRVDFWFHDQDNLISFDTSDGFARYALARD